MKSLETKCNTCTDITGVVLAGGKSRRMGYDKATLKIGEKYLIDFSLEILTGLFSEIFIITHHSHILTLKPVIENREVLLFEDIMPEHGALGGIYTALYHAKTPYIFVCACDMPFLNPSFIRFMASLTNGFDVIIPQSSKMLETLHAFYKRSCLDVIKRFLVQNRNKIIDFFPAVSVHRVALSQIRFYDKQEKMFQNLNTLGDLERAML
jgi:molybdopterin-guanine dinucleotide biosynthesis protein A